MRCERRGETVTTVLLIRHALCDGVGRVLAGRAPGTRLNQEGRLQAECLAERLARFGPSPCAYLLGTRDFEAARRHFELMPASDWLGRSVAWFDPAQLLGIKLGVIA